jgi:hypothetical protein
MKDAILVIEFMKSHPLWDEYEKSLVKHRPSVPTYDPSEDNTSRWKYECARQEGFDLLAKLLKIEVDK